MSTTNEPKRRPVQFRMSVVKNHERLEKENIVSSSFPKYVHTAYNEKLVRDLNRSAKK